jgi:hypothetical protein
MMGVVDDEVRAALERLYDVLGRPAFDTGPQHAAAIIEEATRRIEGLPMTPWPKTRVISTLPNARLTPVVVLGRSLEKAQHGKLKSVYVGIQWADRDEFNYDYSLMSTRDLGMHRLVLERRLNRVAFGADEANETLNPAS